MVSEESVRETIRLLEEIRDNQRAALDKHDEQLALVREQVARSKRQVEESLALQRQAIAKQRVLLRVAFPVIAVCIALVAYLTFKYL